MKEQEANSTKNHHQQHRDCHLGSEHERGSGAAGALRRPALDGVDGSDAADVGGAGIGVGSRSNGGVLVAAVLDPIPPAHVPHLLPYSPPEWDPSLSLPATADATTAGKWFPRGGGGDGVAEIRLIGRG